MSEKVGGFTRRASLAGRGMALAGGFAIVKWRMSCNCWIFGWTIRLLGQTMALSVLQRTNLQGVQAFLAILIGLADQSASRIGVARTFAWIQVCGGPLYRWAHATLGVTELERAVELFEEAAKLTIYEADCVAHAAVLGTLLRAFGFAATVRIGARLTSGRLEAHTWIEVDGRPVRAVDEGAGLEYPHDFDEISWL